jgi:ferritin-like metal-binding protein YciE
MFMATHSRSLVRPLFVTGLQNAHAVERQALALIDRQLDRLVNYPEVAERLREHRLETERQIARLDEIMHEFGESHSAIKDMALGFLGNMAAMSNVMASDEVLKNSFVNHAFENFEIASYSSLIAMADAGAFSAATPLLETSLAEEREMAAWIEQSIPILTRKFLALRADGRVASH